MGIIHLVRGSFTGRIGNIVGQHHAKRDVAKVFNQPKNAKTEKQIQNRTGFKYIQQWGSLNWDLIKPFIKKKVQNITLFNQYTKEQTKNTDIKSWNPTKAIFTQGYCKNSLLIRLNEKQDYFTYEIFVNPELNISVKSIKNITIELFQNTDYRQIEQNQIIINQTEIKIPQQQTLNGLSYWVYANVTEKNENKIIPMCNTGVLET